MKKTLVIIALLLGVLICPCVAGATITPVQGNASDSTSTSVPSLQFTSNDTAGSLLIASVMYYCGTGGGSGDVTVSDNAPGGGNTWTKAVSYWDNSALGVYFYVSIFYAQNTKGTGSEKLTVSVSGYNSNVSAGALQIEEVKGLATSSPVDGTAYAYNFPSYTATSGQTVNGPAITTATNGDLIFTALWDVQSNISAITHGTGFTNLDVNLTQPVTATEYEIQSTQGGITPSYAGITADDSGKPAIIAVAFKAAGSGTTRNLTANMAAVSSAPNIAPSATVRKLTANIAGVSNVQNIIQGAVRMLTANMAGVSSVANIAPGATGRKLTANLAATSSAQNISSSYLRALTANLGAQSSVANIPLRLQNIFAQDPNGQPPSATFTNNDTPGSLLVLEISGQLNANSLPTQDITVTDSVGNVWHETTSGWVLYCCSNPGHYQYNSLWWAQNTNGTGGEQITVNIGWFAGGTSSFYNIDEFYSPIGRYTLDGSAYGLQQYIMANPGSVDFIGPSITPTANKDLIVAFAVDDDGGGVDTWSAGTGFTNYYQWEESGNPLAFSEWMVQGTAANISPDFQFSSTGGPVHLTSVAAAFKLTSGTTRSLTANMAAVSLAANIGEKSVRTLTANVSGTSSSANIAESMARALTAQTAGTSTSSGISEMIARALAANISGISIDSSISESSARMLTAHATGVSSTQNIIQGLILSFSANISGVSTASNITEISARALAANMAGGSSNPNISGALLRSLGANIAGVSITQNASQGIVLSLAAVIAGTSTAAGISETTGRALAANMPASSSARNAQVGMSGSGGGGFWWGR